MYYYGGYSNSQGCGCNNSYQGTYSYPIYGGYNQAYGNGNGAAIVLVLFILLVIIIGTRSFVAA